MPNNAGINAWNAKEKANFQKSIQIPEKVPKFPEHSGILELPGMPKGQ